MTFIAQRPTGGKSCQTGEDKQTKISEEIRNGRGDQ